MHCLSVRTSVIFDLERNVFGERLLIGNGQLIYSGDIRIDIGNIRYEFGVNGAIRKEVLYLNARTGFNDNFLFEIVFALLFGQVIPAACCSCSNNDESSKHTDNGTCGGMEDTVINV